jgi:hypothetical protein
MRTADSFTIVLRTNISRNEAVLIMPWYFRWEFFFVIISSPLFLHVDTGIFVAVRPLILAEPTPEENQLPPAWPGTNALIIFITEYLGV